MEPTKKLYEINLSGEDGATMQIELTEAEYALVSNICKTLDDSCTYTGLSIKECEPTVRIYSVECTKAGKPTASGSLSGLNIPESQAKAYFDNLGKVVKTCGGYVKYFTDYELAQTFAYGKVIFKS